MSSQRQWRPLLLFNIYRLVTAFFLIGFLYQQLRHTPPDYFNEPLFRWLCIAYLVAALLHCLSAHWRWPSLQRQAIYPMVLDVFLLTLLTHASGITSLEIIMLLLVILAGTAILTQPRQALVVCSLASLLLLANQLMLDLIRPEAVDYARTGLLGIAFFITTFLVCELNERARQSELAAASSRFQLASLERLNSSIIQQLHNGLVVVDQYNLIRQANQAAATMFGVKSIALQQPLSFLSGALTRQLERWRLHPHARLETIIVGKQKREINLQIMSLSGKEHSALIVLRDHDELADLAQQVKLAALGRLVASLAHEIRNPLGAISHAAQLLAESPQLQAEDARLSEIIQHHCQRLNEVIENILSLSRKRPSAPETILLKPWLKQFVEHFSVSGLPLPNIKVQVKPNALTTYFDASQLKQVLTNLCENGLRYSYQQTQQATLSLAAQINAEGQVILDIIDQGPGLSEDAVERLFEPFFTESSQGTGLGLYIAKELCDANQAHLQAMPQTAHQGGCFRIEFATTTSQQAIT